MSLTVYINIQSSDDLLEEHKIIETVCETLNTNAEKQGYDIRFNTKLSTDEDSYNEHDFFFGIWSMKLEADAQRKFEDAYENKESNGTPVVKLLVKEPSSVPTDSQETEQLLALQKFVEKQESPDVVYSFSNSVDLYSKVIGVLNEKLLDYPKIKLKEKKKEVIKTIPLEEFLEPQVPVASPPEWYVSRTASHYKERREKNDIWHFLQKDNLYLENLLEKEKRVVLLGNAGSGKSTELRQLFHTTKREDSGLIPIFHRLNSYLPQNGLESLLPEAWTQVPPDSFLLILDGLDEVQPKNFDNVVDQINDFSKNNPNVRMVVSSRTNFYNIPDGSVEGTLSDFEPYFLNELSAKDASKYYQVKYKVEEAEGDKLIHEVHKKGFYDLISRPFFLMMLSESYQQDKQLNEGKKHLYETYFSRQIKEPEVIERLELVAISMEMMGKNQITEREILELISHDEFKTIKHGAIFRKEEGFNDLWRFEHNNLQEYLTAKRLSRLSYEEVIRLITFGTTRKRLLPSWVNTLSFLFSLIEPESDLFQELLKWLIEYERDVIVKFEREKITESTRNQIFQGIFKRSKHHDIWVNSNKFSTGELGLFGATKENLDFLVSEIKSTSSSRTVLLNAIDLLGYFGELVQDSKSEVVQLLLEQIRVKNDENDYYFIHSAIYSLENLDVVDDVLVNDLMKIVCHRNNQYIRSPVYSLLKGASNIEKYLPYLITGIDLTDSSGGYPDRASITVAGESSSLLDCIKAMKTEDAIAKLFDYLSNTTNRLYRIYNSENLIESLVSKAIKLYKETQSDQVYTAMLSWLVSMGGHFEVYRADLAIYFFDETNTRSKAFHELWPIWQSQKDKRRVSYAIGRLIKGELIDFVADLHKKGDLTENDINNVYFEVRWLGNPELEQFEKTIFEKTGLEFPKPKQVDHEAIRKKKDQEEFDLLYDRERLKKETLNIFNSENKTSFTFNELHEIRKKGFNYVALDDQYSKGALRFLRDSIDQSQTIELQRINEWFDNGEGEMYLVSGIYDFLRYNKEVQVNQEQIDWISDWCTKNIDKADFSNGITVSGTHISYNITANFIFFFSIKFNIHYPKETMLDMLWYDDFHRDEEINVLNYVSSVLDNQEISERMATNLEEGIAYTPVLKNHVRFLCEQKVEESYPFVLREIIDTNREDYERRDILDIFFEITKDVEALKSILCRADSYIKWRIIALLKEHGETEAVEQYLLDELKLETDPDEKEKIASELVVLKNLHGLKIYTQLVKSNAANNIKKSHGSVSSFSNIEDPEAIQYLIELLEVAYKEEKAIDRFNNFQTSILGAFEKIALVSEDNFNRVKSALDRFREEKGELSPNVKYLIKTTERLEDQFTVSMAQQYATTINEVKQKLGMSIMDKTTTTKKIFISYSRKDVDFKDRLLTHLKPLEKFSLIKAWDCSKIRAGEWNEQIQKELERSDIMIFMVSANFMASEYIMDNEVQKGIELAKQDSSKKIMCVLVKECIWNQWPILDESFKGDGSSDLSRFQFLPYHKANGEESILALEEWGKGELKSVESAYTQIVEKLMIELKE
ncbi:MAG: TIR domain-containing protein [Bacteroidota bacterium]